MATHSCTPTDQEPVLPWLQVDTPFPDVASAWTGQSQAPGLLAAGADLSVDRLLQAYSHGIFPWFSEGQPILWWSTDPRMVLEVSQFKLHRSLKKTLKAFEQNPSCEIRINHDFASVIRHCAQVGRRGQAGTWIVPEMQQAYVQLHRAGYAHSVETWVDGRLVGGLYCVALGKAVFGESMFALQADASKIALAALVCHCKAHGIETIDCQQNTSHLAYLGAREMPRSRFLNHVSEAIQQPAPRWHFEPLYWEQLLKT